MGKRRMNVAPQTLPDASNGAPVTYTAEQLAEMLAVLSQHQIQSQTIVVAPPEEKPLTEEQLVEARAIPSRPQLSDGTKNPHYDPLMDPGSDRWDAHAYFKRQPQVDVFVHVDPESPDLEVFGMSINGFTLPCYPGKRNRMPKDFVDLLKGRNHRFDVYERRLVSADENQEGSLSLTVAGARPKPFVRRVAD